VPEILPADMIADDTLQSNNQFITGCEHDALSGLLAGSSHNEIAHDLDLSEVTIKHHLKSLRYKLGARNRTLAVCRAIEIGIS